MAKPKSLAGRIAAALASFQLSVAILVFMGLVTYFGTLAQVDMGLHKAQKVYFESWWVSQSLGAVWSKLDWVKTLLPGGQLLMWALAVNLFFGGLFRIKKNRRTAGIIVVHIGIVMLLVASLVKFRGSEDGRLTLYEGQTGSEFIHYHDWEIAIHEANQTENVQEWLIPHEDIAHLELGDERLMTSPDLPLELTVKAFIPNANVVPAPEGMKTRMPVVDGYTVVPQEIDPTNEFNVAAVYVSAMDRKRGTVEDAIQYNSDNHPWTFVADDKPWVISLRHERFNMPFGIKLVDFQKAEHARTSMASSFSSDVLRLQDGDETPVHIRMNEPLRHDGMILFQSGWGPQDAAPGAPLFSTFSVVRNPSDQWPLYSCIVIGIGMAFAFFIRLLGYVGSQRRARQKELASQSFTA